MIAGASPPTFILSVRSGVPHVRVPSLHRLNGWVRPLAVLACCLGAACTFAPRAELPQLDSTAIREVPGEFAESAVAGAYEPLEWWRAFGDPVLDDVVDTALASNFDMAEAVARVAQARETALLAKAAIFPVIGARARVDDLRSPTDAGIGAQVQELGLEELLGGLADDFTLPDRLGLTNYTLSADVAYEFDFWGRVRSNRLAAGADYLASESDLRAVRIGILSETIAAYFEIVELREQIALFQETVEVLQEREEVAATRYARGLADSLDLYRVRQELRDTQAGLPQLEHRLAAAEGRLAALLGGYREGLQAILPETLSPNPSPDAIPAGVPADLLLQRPDVQAAGHRLDAAGYAMQARRAELMPSLSLSGSIGLQSASIGDWFNVHQWFTNLAGNLLAPVFDGGRLETQVAIAEARFNELAAAYGRTVVTAVNEVEAAMARLEGEGRRHAFLVSRQEEAQATLDLRSARYASGIGGYADFLDALRALLAVESALAGVERDLALARLAVHRALGGSWIARETPDPTDAPDGPEAADAGAQIGSGPGTAEPQIKD